MRPDEQPIPQGSPGSFVMSRLSFAILTIAGLVSPIVLPSWAGAQTPPPERIEAFRSRLGPSSELKLTQTRLVHSPTITAEGVQFSKPGAAPESTAVLIPWSQVDRLDKGVSLAGRGALVGGLLGAVAVGALAGAVSAGAGLTPTHEADPGAVVSGVVIGGLAGAALGATIAAPINSWAYIHRGQDAPSRSARNTIAQRTSGQSVKVESNVVVTNPVISDDGIAGRITSENNTEGGNVDLAWPAIDRVAVRGDVRGGSSVRGILVGALLGAAIGWGVTSAVPFEPRDAQYVLVGCSVTGAWVGWNQRARPGDWTEVYRRENPPPSSE